MNILDGCIGARQLASKTLAEALRELLALPDPISEVALAELWLNKLMQHESVYPDGWYMPPPHGMFVQFGTDSDPSRVNNPSNRIPSTWPRSDIYLDRAHGIISAYASPVDLASGMIGDMCVMLYFGPNSEIQTHLKSTLQLDYDIFAELRPDMKLSEVATMAHKIMETRGFQNTVASSTDSTGTNIGHTIPASDTGWSSSEQAIFAAGNWLATADMISRRRLFINTSEPSRIAPTMAHTIEPRPEVPGRSDLPTSPYHTIVIWRDGQKQLLTGFDELFHLAGMDYMSSIR